MNHSEMLEKGVWGATGELGDYSSAEQNFSLLWNLLETTDISNDMIYHSALNTGKPPSPFTQYQT